MELFEGNKYIEIDDETLEDSLLGSGNEANVYYYKGRILKIYKSSNKKVLNEKEVLEMSHIDTKRFLLPEEPLYDINKNFIGYARRYIIGYYKEIIGKMKLSKFIDEISYMEEDIEKFSNEKIDIEDLNMDNVLIGDGIYISDPGSFIKMDELRVSQIRSNNKNTFKNFIINDLIPNCIKLTKKEINNLSLYLKKEDSISDYISTFSKKQNESVNSFMKKLSLTLSK